MFHKKEHYLQSFFSVLLLVLTNSEHLFPSSKSLISPHVYDVCSGNNTDPNCDCYSDGIVQCTAWRWGNSKIFETANIRILKQNFTVTFASLSGNNFRVLKKGEFFPNHALSIQKLQLDRNNIVHIENGAFDDFIVLKSLDLTLNKISHISCEVFTSKLGSTLSILRLDGDQIISIDFKYLTNLEILDLSNHRGCFTRNCEGYRAIQFNDVFPKALSNLQILYLSFRGIKSLDENTFANLTNLNELHLNYNPISSIPKAINFLPNLRYLNMDLTQVISLNSRGIYSHEKLEELLIRGPKFSSIENCAFCSFPNMKKLILDFNEKLSYIHENAFGYAHGDRIPVLKYFTIEYANLKTIPEKLLNWDNLTSLGIHGNPLNCNCSLKWLMNTVSDQNRKSNLNIHIGGYNPNAETLDKHLKCKEPFELKNVPLYKIDKDLCLNVTSKESSNPQSSFFHDISQVF